MADEEGIYFDRTINERLRGVSRMESLNIILERAEKAYTEDEKVQMATRKNGYYVEFIQALTPADILPGVMETLEELKAKGHEVEYFGLDNEKNTVGNSANAYVSDMDFNQGVKKNLKAPLSILKDVFVRK